jgi:endonuclease/exonuclease/phosphatase (EEP) superfamily protein YafD
VAGLSVLVAALLLGAVAVGGEQNIAVALLAALAGWVPVLLVVGLGAAAMGRARALLVASGVLLVVSLLWQQPFPANVWKGAEAAGGRTDVTVLALNMKFGHADPAQLLAQVQRTRPDVVVLTELTLDAAADLRAGGLDRLLPYSQAEGRFDASGTGVWSRYPLGSPRELAGTRYVGIQATLTIAGRPVALTAVHPSAPTEIAQWTADYARITAAVQRSIAEPGVTQIVAGDLNASSGNGPLRRLLATGLDDAASATSWSWGGLTWPADRPFPPLTRIDHVLTSPDATAQSVSTFSIAGTDHRGVVARLSIPRG